MLIGCGDGSGRRGTQARKNLTDNIFGNSRALPAYLVENRVALVASEENLNVSTVCETRLAVPHDAPP